MELNSPLTGGIAQSYAPGLGNGIEVPAILLPTVSVGLPTVVTLNVTQDFRGRQASGHVTAVINQGPSSGAGSFQFAFLDKGLWRLSGQLVSTNFVGPAASSAAPICARITLYVTPNVASNLCSTFLQPSVPQYAYFNVTVNVLGATDLWLESFANTGVGESIGIYGSAFIERLL